MRRRSASVGDVPQCRYIPGTGQTKRACELLEVSRAAYYAHRAATPSARRLADDELTEHLRQVHQASKGR
jgi:hypothetical protein